jgi:hypothetical protein
VIGVESGTGETLFAADMRGPKRLLAPNDDGHRHMFARGSRPLLAWLYGWTFFAAGQYGAALSDKVGNRCLL